MLKTRVKKSFNFFLQNQEWQNNDLKARRMLVDCIDNECLEYVKSKQTSNEMW